MTDVDWTADVPSGAKVKRATAYPTINWAGTQDLIEVETNEDGEPARDSRGKTKTKAKHLGVFYVKSGQNEELDEELAAAGVPIALISFRKGASFEWHFILGPALDVIVLSRGLQTLQDAAGDAKKLEDGKPLTRYGLSFGWTPKDEETGVSSSFLRIPVLVRRISGVRGAFIGKYDKPLILSFKKRTTDNVFEALAQMRDEIIVAMTARVDGAPVWPAALVAVAQSYEDYTEGLVKVHGEKAVLPPKKVFLYCASMPIGYAGEEVKGADPSKTREVAVPGFRMPSDGIDDRWLADRVINRDERSCVEHWLAAMEVWALEDSAWYIGGKQAD